VVAWGGDRGDGGKGISMKRSIIVTAMALTLAAGAGVHAERGDAAFWPANCDAQMRAGHPVLALQCVDRHLNNLNRRVQALGRNVRRDNFCTAFVFGVSRFDGYAAFQDPNVERTALDFDGTEQPGAWVQEVRPACVTGSAAARSPDGRVTLYERS
jgi:hypothetical protein